VTDGPAAQAAAAQVEAALAGATLAGLVNNAGIAVSGPLLYLPVDEFRQQLEVNLTGVVIATQAFAPLLGARPPTVSNPGRIVNISSVGGRTANPFMAPYNASKFGLEGLSEGLRRELLPFGVDVVVVAPGAVATPIWEKADEVDVSRYANTPYATVLDRFRAYMLQIGRAGLPPEKIGEAIHHALTTPKPKVRYTVTGDPLRIFMAEHLPKRMLDRTVGKQLGMLPEGR
ncbi:MAG TPA: SDR family NAD(P)-dependent oxidoreductase, partial [Phenylobacterium sp.]